MQVKQVAELLGVEPKAVISEVEAQREKITGMGLKLAKKLTAASSLEDDVARHVLASFDQRQQQKANEEKAAEDRRHREEAERRRNAELLERERLDQERRAREAAARAAAEAELERKRAEEAARLKAEQEAAERRAEEARQKAEQEAAERRAAEEAARAAEAARRAAAAEKAQAELKAAAAAPPVAAAPAAAVPAAAPAPAAAPVASAPVAARPAAPVAPAAAAPAVAPQAPRAPQAPTAPNPGMTPRPPMGGMPRTGAPAGPGQRPAGPPSERPAYTPRPQGERREGGEGQRPYGDRPQGPRPNYSDRPNYQDRQGGPPSGGQRPYGDRPQGPRPNFSDRPNYQDRQGGPPRNYGDRPQGGPGGAPRPYGDRQGGGPGGPRPYGDRQGGGPGGAPRPYGDRQGGGPGGAPRPYGDRQGGGPGGPRPYGDRQGGGPGGPRPYGDRQGGGPGGPRPYGDRQGGPGRPGGPGGRPGQGRGEGHSPARREDLLNFVGVGIQTDVVDDFARNNTRRTGKKDEKGRDAKDRDWTEEQKKKAKLAAAEADKKRIRPSQVFGMDEIDAGGDRRKAKRRPSGPPEGQRSSRQMPPEPIGPKVIKFSGDFTVGEFAEKSGIGIAEVMKKLLLSGKRLTINNLMDPDLAEELAIEFSVEIVIERESDEADIKDYIDDSESDEDLQPRAPVVTIMGHVDHGKTTLLDRIRKADVASTEFGGITQHIGAYLVNTPKGNIAFLDTPGHEAFTEMRSRGANVTDLVVLVVAANDGVMPQTVEAINHAKAAEVPILVAINKVDAQGSNPDRVKQELMKHGLVPEEYGGETIMIPVSAMTGQGVDSLLEYIALQTEILELKANPNCNAVGTVVESHVDPLRGAVATVLVERGTLRIGDVFVCGTESGRVRAMRDDRDNQVKEAGPAVPVEILGLSGSPVAGEKFVVVESEAEARDIAEKRESRRKLRKANAKTHITLDTLSQHLSDGKVLSLNLIVKGDVQGSVEAINGALLKIKSDKVHLRILHSAVGAVSASDVQLADASEAIILAFNVTTDPAAKNMAEELGVDIRGYQIIYALLEDMEKAMVGMLEPTFTEKSEGRARVQDTFKVSKIGTAAGCLVEEGTVAMGHHARLIRDGAIVWRGKLKSLRRVKDDVKQVLSGVECGIGLEKYDDIKVGDIIETYSLVQQEASLLNNPGR